MQQFKTFSLIILSAFLFFSCSQSQSGDPKTGSSDNSPASTDNASNGGSFSANIDGEEVSGGQIDDMQLQNTAFIYPGTDNGKRLLFFLYSDKKGNISYTFRFSVPDKTGSFTKKDLDGQPFDITLNLLGGDNSRYGAADVSINTTSITASKITGTFSGKFILSNDTPNGTKKEVTVSNGKFDIPFSTGNIKPE